MGRQDEMVDRLFELFVTTDEEQREALAAELVTEDVEFRGLVEEFEFDGINEFVAGFRADGELPVLVRTSAVDGHSGWIRNTWEVHREDGTAVPGEDGMPFGGLQVSQVTDGGRFRRIIVWFGVEPSGRE